MPASTPPVRYLRPGVLDSFIYDKIPPGLVAAMAATDAAFARFGCQGFGRAFQEQNSRSRDENTLTKNSILD
jgi:hypothetical protein